MVAARLVLAKKKSQLPGAYTATTADFGAAVGCSSVAVAGALFHHLALGSTLLAHLLRVSQ